MPDIISQITNRRRGILIGLSVIAILLSKGLISIPPEEPLSFGGQKFQVEVDVLYWLLAAALIYQFINFVWSFVDDLGTYRTHIKGEFESIRLSMQRIADTQEAIHSLQTKILANQEEISKEEPDLVAREFQQHIETVDGSINTIMRKLSNRWKSIFLTKWSWALRIYGWELFLPFVLAVYALWGVISLLA